MASFSTKNGSTIRGKVICQGPKAVVVGETYREIFLLDSNGVITERHSHGYQGDGWQQYFHAVCGRSEVG